MEKSFSQKVLISQDRKFEIPQLFYAQLHFSDEAECLVVDGNLVLKPVTREAKLSECLRKVREKYAALPDAEDSDFDAALKIVKDKRRNTFQKSASEIFGDD